MSDLKVGAVVKVTSGGPDMTVKDLGDYSPMHSENSAKCVWFDGKKLNEEVFGVDTLKHAPKGFVGVI